MSFVRNCIASVVSRLPPPRVIYDRMGETPYLSRYYLIGDPPGTDENGQTLPSSDGTSREFSLFLHRFHRSDDDDALHNHPWKWALSLVLAGGYTEERRVGACAVEVREVRPGQLNFITDETFHRVLLKDHDAWTLFLVGPKIGSWGFWEKATGIFYGWREWIALKRNERTEDVKVS